MKSAAIPVSWHRLPFAGWVFNPSQVRAKKGEEIADERVVLAQADAPPLLEDVPRQTPALALAAAPETDAMEIKIDSARELSSQQSTVQMVPTWTVLAGSSLFGVLGEKYVSGHWPLSKREAVTTAQSAESELITPSTAPVPPRILGGALKGLSTNGETPTILHEGDLLRLELQINEPVTVTSSSTGQASQRPTVDFVIGDRVVKAYLVLPEGPTSLLTFELQIPEGLLDQDGVTLIPGQLTLNQATITSTTSGLALSTANWTLGSTSSTSWIVDSIPLEIVASNLSGSDDQLQTLAPFRELRIQYSQDIELVEGVLTLREIGANADDVRTVEVTSSALDQGSVRVEGQTLILTWDFDLQGLSTYQLEGLSGVVRDLDGEFAQANVLSFGTQVNTQLVVFDLASGTSSEHSDRTFSADVTYQIFIAVGTNLSLPANLPVTEMWHGGNHLGADDQIVIVGTLDGLEPNAVGPNEQADALIWQYQDESNTRNLAYNTVSGAFLYRHDLGGIAAADGDFTGRLLWTGRADFQEISYGHHPAVPIYMYQSQGLGL